MVREGCQWNEIADRRKRNGGGYNSRAGRLNMLTDSGESEILALNQSTRE